MLLTQQTRYDHQVATWLLLCAMVIFGMIVLGGVTRLTGSGLSMVEWKPLMGVIPPLSEEAWLATFEKYRQYPEYQQVNRGMDLAGFKYIFMYEYLHRVLGRVDRRGLRGCLGRENPVVRAQPALVIVSPDGSTETVAGAIDEDLLRQIASEA